MSTKNSELGIVHHAWALSDSYLHLDLLHVISIRGRPGKLRFNFKAMGILILLIQLLSVRQTDDVVVHLPPSSKSNTSNTSKSNTSTIYMVIALHGMGPNYPDLFQHEVEKIPFFSADPKRLPGTPWRIALESLLWSTL